ncbi:AMP-dependent synthetase and ligase domain protein [Mycobacterium xenopi 3993]|nr:AMP-dependent synthetase and ligase domain protein [Mycobacterium xenopi 3993]
MVPLSTLLPPRELLAQLRVAAVQFLVTVEEFRDTAMSTIFGRRWACHWGRELLGIRRFLRCVGSGQPTG